jgi:hypothetical protein
MQICYRPCSLVQQAVILEALERAGVKTELCITLFWPRKGSVEMLPVLNPPIGQAEQYESAFYVTLASPEEAQRAAAVTPVVGGRCSPAELLHIPFLQCRLQLSQVAPFEGLLQVNNAIQAQQVV